MSRATFVRTVALVLAVINIALGVFGLSPLPNDQISQAMTAVFEVSVILWAWWKNNSVTPAAIEADTWMRELKDTNKTEND